MIDKRKFEKKLKDKYSFKDETFFAVPKPDLKDKVEVEIGDSKTIDKFLPQVKVQRWDNECNVSFRLKDDGIEEETVDTVSDKIVWKKGKREAHFYDIQNAEHPEGASEFEVVLLEKPSTNVVEFTVVDKDVEYFYQPALTPEEIAEGNERPENVVGSYAVYTKTPKTNWEGGKEYRTGKVGHIFRPRIEDSVGNWVWGDLHVENGTLSVTIPQDFLDNAVYPVKHAAGLTIGHTTISFTGSTLAQNFAAGSTLNSVVSVDGTVTSLSFFCLGNGQTFKGFITDSSFNILTNGVSDVGTGGLASAWKTTAFSTPPSVTNGQSYYPWIVSNGGLTYYYDSGSSGDTKTETDNSYATPTNPSSVSDSTRRYAIYATYTASSGFPVVESVTDTDITSSLTSHVVSMPATVNSGDRLIALAHYRNAGTWSTIPTGWSNLGEQAGGGSVGEMLICEKIADGTEGGTTATWVTGTGTTAAWQVVRISGAHASTASEIGTTSGDSSAADPPSKTISGWSGENTLWIAAAGHSAASTSAWSAGSFGFVGFSSNGSSSGGSACCIAHCYDTDNSDTVNPGAFTASGSNRWWAAATIAVRPAAAGGPTYTLTATSGAFTETGIAAGTLVSRNIQVSNATFTLTGISSGFNGQRYVSLTNGSLALSGITAQLSKALRITAVAETFTLSGVSSILTKAVVMVVSVGTYTITGVSNIISRGYSLTADTVSYIITGYSLLFGSNYGIVCTTGSFTLTGIVANTTKAFNLTASVVSFTMNGIATSLAKYYALSCTNASFVISGISNQLSRLYSFIASVGTFTLTGVSLLFGAAYGVTCTVGSFSVNGVAASLARTLTLVSNVASFVVTGISNGFVNSRVIQGAIGTFTLTGRNTVFNYSSPSLAGNIIFGIAL